MRFEWQFDWYVWVLGFGVGTPGAEADNGWGFVLFLGPFGFSVDTGIGRPKHDPIAYD